jgi:methionine synthase II (cobalamin-independent)
VHAALKYIDPSKLLLAPDCGLMTISRELAREKAAFLVALAKEVTRGL